MLNYDARWNKGGQQRSLILHIADQVIATRKFIDERGFDDAYKDLRKERDRWNSSDQFIGEHLEIFVS